MVLAYLRHTSAYRRPQITRLVARWEENRLAPVPLVKRYRAPAAPFARKYTAVDVALLAQVDRANEDVCGPAIAHLLRRAYTVYGDKDYKRASAQRRMVSRQPHVGRPGQRWLLSRRAVGRAMSAIRGIILAGGAGTRLHPLTLTVQQATAAGLPQDDDLLPAVGTDAGRHPRGVADQHPARSSAVLGPAR